MKDGGWGVNGNYPKLSGNLLHRFDCLIWKCLLVTGPPAWFRVVCSKTVVIAHFHADERFAVKLTYMKPM